MAAVNGLLATENSLNKVKRQPNWTEKEKVTLVNEYDKHRMILKSRPSRMKPRDRRNAWEAITRVINSQNPWVPRTVKDVQKKWHNMVSVAKLEISTWREKQQELRDSGQPCK